MLVVKEERNPILVCGSLGIPFLSWDSLWIYHPCVLRKDGQYYMFYSGRTGFSIKHEIGLATSVNLVTWDRSPTNPVLRVGSTREWDGGLVAHGYVIEKDDKYYMFYDGSPRNLWREEIGIAISGDLEKWEKHPKNPLFRINPTNKWEKAHVSRSSIIREGNTYYLFYAGHDGVTERIGVALSTDLIYWTRSKDNPILDLGERGAGDEKSVSDPKVFKIDGSYMMFYSGYDSEGIGRIYVALSKDLIHWKKNGNIPILDVGQNGAWDRLEACRSDILPLDGKYYLFYSGRSARRYKIGLAQITGLSSILE